VIWVFIVLLIGYGNAKSLRVPSAVPAEPWPGLALAGLLALLVFAATRAGPRLSWSELGLVRAGSARPAALGLLIGVAAALVALVVLRFPPILDEPVRYAPLLQPDPVGLLLRALVFMPLDTAVPEELAFRGLLFGWLRRGGRVTRAVLLGGRVRGVASGHRLRHAPRDERRRRSVDRGPRRARCLRRGLRRRHRLRAAARVVGPARRAARGPRRVQRDDPPRPGPGHRRLTRPPRDRRPPWRG